MGGGSRSRSQTGWPRSQIICFLLQPLVLPQLMDL
jgi:hypothetical protein